MKQKNSNSNCSAVYISSKKIKSSLYLRYYAEACYEWWVHLRGIAPGEHSCSEETSQRWRAVGDTVPDLSGPGIEPQTFRADSDVRNINIAGRLLITLKM